MRSVSPVLACCIVLAFAVSCSQAIGSSSPGAISVIAAPVNAALDTAYRRGNATAAVALMTDSVVISAEGIPDLSGRPTVRDLLTQFFAGNTVEAFTLQPIELQLYGNQAFERGTFLWAAGPKGGTITRRKGRYTILRVRESDGAWRIHRYLENCLPAPCP